MRLRVSSGSAVNCRRPRPSSQVMLSSRRVESSGSACGTAMSSRGAKKAR